MNPFHEAFLQTLLLLAPNLPCSSLTINMGLQSGPDIDQLLRFLSILILAFINEGSSSLSSAFMNEPWSYCVSIPFSLYLKFALELHAHLGICVGIGLPSLVYWGATRSPIDLFWDKLFKFNSEILKSGLVNLVIGLLHLLVSKLIHKIIEWVKDHKIKGKGLLFPSPVISKLESVPFSQHPLLRPVSANDIFLKLLESLFALFFNGNVLLLSWCFSGQEYTYEVGKAISWVSMGSSMFVWIKSLLKLSMPQELAPEEKPQKKVEESENSSSVQSLETNDQAINCSLECWVVSNINVLVDNWIRWRWCWIGDYCFWCFSCRLL